MKAEWKTYYIYYYDNQKQDELITLIQKKMTALLEDKKILKWFFIRYWEGGPHIRVRFLTSQNLEYKEVFTDVIAFIKDNPFNGILTKKDYYSNITFEGPLKNIDELPWYEEGEIIDTEYLPEYDRYGGEKLMPLTETLFMESSELSGNLINLSKNKGFIMRFVLSAITVTNIVNQLEEQGFLGILKNDFYDNCVKCWRGINSINDMTYADKLLQNCIKNSEVIDKLNKIMGNDSTYKYLIENLLDGFTQIYREIKDYKYFRSILFSHLHMINNRLGIIPEYECALYFSIMKGGIL